MFPGLSSATSSHVLLSPPSLLSLTNNFNLTASSRHPGPSQISWWEKIVIWLFYFTPLVGWVGHNPA